MNVFHMKTQPGDNPHFKDFIDGGFVAIGWPDLGDLTHATKEEIRNRIAATYNISGHALGNYLGQVNCFVNTMQKDDVVVITQRDMAYIGIVGEYYYDENQVNSHMCHRRSTKWTANVLIRDLENGLQRILGSRNVISQYHETFESSGLEQYIHGQLKVDKKDLSKLEALFANALEVLEEELKSTDPDRRLKAATELLRLKTNR